jgi:hypothetical protein
MESLAAITATVAAAAPSAGTMAASASLASAGLNLAGALSQAGQMKVQANQAMIQARAERLRGEQQGNQVRQALLRTLAAQNARYAAAGLSGLGSAEALEMETRAQANAELNALSGSANLAGLAAEAEAAGLRSSARTTRTFGAARAALSIFDAADRLGARQPGVPTTPAYQRGPTGRLAGPV